MPNAIKKILSVLTLLLVAIPFMFSVFSVAKLVIIKAQVSKALESEQLQTILVTENDAKWITPGKEILIKGKLFDVESFKCTNNNLEVTGLFDKEEDNLQDHVNNMFHQKQQGNAADSTTLINLIFHILYTEKNTPFKTDMAVILLKKYHFGFSENLVSVNSDIHLPPPKA